MACRIPEFRTKNIFSSIIQLGVAAVLLFSLFHENVVAAEVITNFHARVEVAKNGDLTVTETIAVVAEGREIKRGIFRDFPRSFVDEDDTVKRVSFDVISVKRNGLDEPFNTTAINGDTRIYIGDKNVFLDDGPYTYELKYRTDRQIKYLDTYDEVYWNVTGNGWSFPIESASAEVILPEGESFADLDYFTGFAGETGKNARAILENNRRHAVFATTAPLARNQGLTIVATTEKGAINLPGRSQKFWWFMRDRGHILIGLITLAMVSLYYVFVWSRVGRDPAGGTIVPRWDMPDDVSPALVNYIANKERMGQGWKAMTSAIIDLAVKGHLLIEDLDDEPVLTATQKASDGVLPVGEAVIMSFIKDRETLKLAKNNGKSVRSMQSKFTSAIENENRRAFYQHNTLWIVLGIILSVIGILSTVFFNLSGIISVFFVFMFCGILFAVTFPVFLMTRAVLRVHDAGLRVVGILVIGLVSAAILVGVGWFISVLLDETSVIQHLPFVFGLIGIVGVNVLFFSLMGAPTQAGAQMGSAIEGLRLYLNFAEKDRMALAGAPEMSPQHFETLLPYAIALGFEQQWSDTFESWLASAAAAQAGVRQYRPDWNRDRSLLDRNIGERFGGIGTKMSSGLSSSVPTRSRSSGMSSGSSGGGGGGGGGGGW